MRDIEEGEEAFRDWVSGHAGRYRYSRMLSVSQFNISSITQCALFVSCELSCCCCTPDAVISCWSFEILAVQQAIWTLKRKPPSFSSCGCFNCYIFKSVVVALCRAYDAVPAMFPSIDAVFLAVSAGAPHTTPSRK